MAGGSLSFHFYSEIHVFFLIITHMNRNGFILFMFKVSWTSFFALKWPLLVVSVNEKSFESLFSWLAWENIFHAIKIWLLNLLSKTWLKYEFLLLLVSLQKFLLFPQWFCWGQGRVMFVSTVHQECFGSVARMNPFNRCGSLFQAVMAHWPLKIHDQS